jgi:PKD repeat protein/ferredoxin
MAGYSNQTFPGRSDNQQTNTTMIKPRLALALFALAVAHPLSLRAATSALLGWNNLGMHCMDSDYSVFSVLPPYNTIESQLIVGGKLVTNGVGYTVTYQAVADPSGSFNSTAMGKGNYYTYAQSLFGATLAPEGGLAGWNMPGVSNTPQSMLFETTNTPAPGAPTRVNWFRAEGIPISPFDDAHRKNPYPLMRLIARNSGGIPIATNDIVLPVSDEMDCRACHASGTQAAAQPANGWLWDGLPERDFRLNILRLHDEHQFARQPALYTAALAARGFNPQGLYRGVVADDKPVLCAACHASEALGAPSFGTIPQLTTSVHSRHATVQDPQSGLTLDNSANRQACYLCHPGSTTKCLRGAMGGAIATDGLMEMQCQSCHGNMSAVGSTNRVGWFMEPNCQGCHTGTATSNNGLIRYTSSSETNGVPRVAINQTFATSPNTPVGGLSLYRFSTGHGGLQCSACHGSTHAEFPSTHANDNLRNQAIQGHAGMMIECTACHTTMTASATTIGTGPHGLHPLGQTMVDNHPDLLENGTISRAQCQACHGSNYRGSVLAKAQMTRTVSSKFGTMTYWRGQQVGCYDCHNGANSSNPTANTPPVVASVATNTLNSASVIMTLPGTDANGHPLTFRIVAQPAHGSLGVSNHFATYYPEPGFVGTEQFTFAANDSYADSNLGTGTVAVAQGPYSITAAAHVPSSYPAGWPVAFSVVPKPVNTVAPVNYYWTFGDGAQDTNQFPTHTYTTPGTYLWTVTATAGAATTQNSGLLLIVAPVWLRAATSGSSVTVAWDKTTADTLLETTSTLGTSSRWTPVTNTVIADPSSFRVTLPAANGNGFFRLLRPW